ncbi:MAG TPA: response regulator [Elusimicrobiales bacterium]|nr:response regulator [Elusimicrobiales bacterium]
MTERILLVDDDHGVLEFCSCLLSKNKFAVTACSSAAEALAFMRGGSYDILLTDLNLGDGCGTDLLAFSKLVAPAARALLMTGDAAQPAALKKPFTGRELLSAVSA